MRMRIILPVLWAREDSWARRLLREPREGERAQKQVMKMSSVGRDGRDRMKFVVAEMIEAPVPVVKEWTEDCERRARREGSWVELAHAASFDGSPESIICTQYLLRQRLQRWTCRMGLG